MSGVNRNIIGNMSVPVMGQGVTNIDLVTSGSRWIIMNFPQTFLSSSNGGTCDGITLQWTPDPSFGFEATSSYYAVTQSILPCEPYSLLPLTSSLGYEQFINSPYSQSPATYYMRAFQNKVGGSRGPYSDIVSVNTISGCGGGGGDWTFDVESYDPLNNLWYAFQTSGSAGKVGAWTGSTTPEVIKYNGYDAIKTYGSTLRIPLAGNIINNQPFEGSIGLANGSATIFSEQGQITLNVACVTSTGAEGSGNTVLCVGEEANNGYLGSGLNTFNRVVSFVGGGPSSRNGSVRLDGTGSGDPYVTSRVGSSTYGSGYLEVQTSADCIIRAFTWGYEYNAGVYHCKYGPGGS